MNSLDIIYFGNPKSEQVLDDKLVLMRVISFCWVINWHLFLFSYFGTMLMEESLSVGVEVSQVSWYNIASVKQRKSLILIILRSQRLTGIKAGRFSFITLQTYIEALNVIISYFSVLRALLVERN